MKLVANKPCNLNGKKYFIGEEVPVEEVVDYASLVKMGLLSVIHDAVPADNLEECVAMVGEVSFSIPIVKGDETIDLDVTEPVISNRSSLASLIFRNEHSALSAILSMSW